MLSQEFQEVLSYVSAKLDDMEVNWAVVGSSNLAMHGMNVEPNDLDIATSVEGIHKAEEIFSDYIEEGVKESQASSDGGTKFYEMKLSVDDLEVHFLGGDEEDVYFEKIRQGRKEALGTKDSEIWCLTLKAEMEAYEEVGKITKAERVKRYRND